LVAAPRTRNWWSKHRCGTKWLRKWFVVVEAQKLMNTVMENVICDFKIELADIEEINLQTIEFRHRNTSNASPSSV
jgi:hypothetical protein